MANVLIGNERTRGEKAIGIAERLSEARRVQRWLLGDAYGRLVRDPMEILRKLAPEHGGVLGALHTVLVDMRREVLENAGLGTLLAAAAVELIEPDGLTPEIGEQLREGILAPAAEREETGVRRDEGTAVTEKEAAGSYIVETWDPDLHRFTPQNGVPRGPYSKWGLRTALRKLREMGYGANRSDTFVLVKRKAEELR